MPPSLHRITVVGGDLAVPVWVLALRAEAAWIHGRFFPLLIRDQVGQDPRLVATVREAVGRGRAQRPSPRRVALPLPATELERESVQFGVGVDYFVRESTSRRLIGSSAVLARAFVLLQLIETVIVDHDAPFIADRIEHLLALTLRQSFRDERVLGELKVAINPEPRRLLRLAPAHLQAHAGAAGAVGGAASSAATPTIRSGSIATVTGFVSASGICSDSTTRGRGCRAHF